MPLKVIDPIPAAPAAPTCNRNGLAAFLLVLGAVLLTVFDVVVMYKAPRFDLFGPYGGVEFVLLVLYSVLFATVINVYQAAYFRVRVWYRNR